MIDTHKLVDRPSTLYVLMFRFRLLVVCSFWSSLFTISNTCCMTASCRRSSFPWGASEHVEYFHFQNQSHP